MRLNHVGIVCSTRENSERFFGELLGLAKTREKTVPAELCLKLFGQEREYRAITYANEQTAFEVFISGAAGCGVPAPSHTCLGVRDLQGFVSTCSRMGVEVITAPKGDSYVTFIKDYDGNLYEIQQSA